MAGPTASPTPPGSGDSINVLYSFDGTHGADPKGSLVLGEVGSIPTLFGRTSFGGAGWDASDPAGAPGGGVIFSLPATGGSFSGEFDFPGGTDGYQPHHDAMVLLGSTLWGAALFSGTISENGSGDGAVYSIDSANLGSSYAVAHAFAGAPDDGANSHSSFGVGSDGETLYGTTAAGAAGSGTIYCYNTADDPSSACYDSVNHVPYLVLFSFANGTGTPSGCTNCTGSTPHGRPVVVNIGTMATPIDVLLGMTRQGGYTSGGNSKGNGAIYAYTPSADAYTVLHLFNGSTTDGAFTDHGNLTLSAFVPASGGTPAQITIYGMTTDGGAHDKGSPSPTGDGVIFAATVALPTPAAVPTITAYTIMHNFGGSSVKNLVTSSQVADGYNPYGSLVMDNGYLYGMARNGGANGGGVIFRMNPETLVRELDQGPLLRTAGIVRLTQEGRHRRYRQPADRQPDAERRRQHPVRDDADRRRTRSSQPSDQDKLRHGLLDLHDALGRAARTTARVSLELVG